MTFFCGFFNYPNTLAILDNFFLDDWQAVFRIALALLNRFKKELMQNTDIAYVAQFFHTLRDKAQLIDVHELLNEALQIFPPGLLIDDQTQELEIEQLESEYFSSMAA